MTILRNLSRAVSEERLAPYRQDAEDSLIVPFARYFWNMELGESLYPTLQTLEIALRNSLHEAISVDRGTVDWFEEVLDPKDKPAFEEIKNRLSRHKIPLTAGQIVANSDLGFWIRLLNSRYENVLWPKLLRSSFPAMPNSIRTRRSLSKRLNRIRALRNRVFHFEPVWNDSSLAQKHEEIKETIAWINPSMLKAVSLFDRFPKVVLLTYEHYEYLLASDMGQ